jgi:hypothetical protein
MSAVVAVIVRNEAVQVNKVLFSSSAVKNIYFTWIASLPAMTVKRWRRKKRFFIF